MTVLVDEARWPWRGRHWAHLVSDESFDELHELARRIGKRRLGFQGDHYDVDDLDRGRALELGAEPVEARELVRRLRASGLRRRHPKPSWRRLAVSEPGEDVDMVRDALFEEGRAGERLVVALHVLGSRTAEVSVGAFADAARVVVLLDVAPRSGPVDVGAVVVDQLIVGEPRHDGERSIELFVDR